MKCKIADVTILTGLELREWRKSIGWSQDVLARELGVSRPTVSAWEALQEYIPRTVFLAVQALEAMPHLRGYGRDGHMTFGGLDES